MVSGAQVVPHLSFAEASELAFFGAKVLHPSTILPAVHVGFPSASSTRSGPKVRQPDYAGGAGHAGAVTALACKRNITVVDITSTRMLLAHGIPAARVRDAEHHAIG